MHARTVTIRGEASKVDAAVEQVRSEVVPVLRDTDGFKDMRLLVDREGGTIIGISCFESREALEASEETVRASRRSAAQAAGAPDPEVRFFEVAVDTAT